MINNSNIMEKSAALVDQKQTANHPGKGKWTKLATLALLGIFASGLVGCVGRYTGGGSIDSVVGAPQKATFGFALDATNPDENGYPTDVTGQFQFNDHAAGVSFHANQLQQTYSWAPGPAIAFNFIGTYTCNQGTGTVQIGVASHDQVAPPLTPRC